MVGRLITTAKEQKNDEDDEGCIDCLRGSFVVRDECRQCTRQGRQRDVEGRQVRGRQRVQGQGRMRGREEFLCRREWLQRSGLDQGGFRESVQGQGRNRRHREKVICQARGGPAEG